jgi:DNA (cytosine-5)-methyltransferase 1
MSNPQHIFTFFSGLGFLDLGFEKQGFEVVHVNEFHGPFLDAYKHARGRMGIPEPRYGYHGGSIEDYLKDKKLSVVLRQNMKLSRKEGQTVGFIGGPPCPDFSIAGKQRGSSGDNGKLSRVYAELIDEMEPDWFLFENVKGLWRTKKHRAFYEELKEFLSKKYEISEKLVNSLWYGVPQDRDRIIMVGFLKPTSKKLDEEDWTGHFKHKESVLNDHEWPEKSPFGHVPRIGAGIPKELTVGFWFEKNAVERHPNADKHFTPKAGLARFKSVEEGDDKKKSFKRLHRHRYSPTAAYGNNEVHLHPWLPRRISVAEALAIQSLPKSFELPPEMTLSNAFKGIGNGVPFLMSQGIAKMISSKVEQ